MAQVENTYALTSLERVKRHLGQTTNTDADAELVRLINEVSAAMESFCGRKFRSRTWTHDGTTLARLDSYGGTQLVLAQAPVTTVSSLKTYPTGSALTEGYDEDFVILHDEGIIQLVNGNGFYGSSTTPSRQVVEITYTAGYLDSPSNPDLQWGWDTQAVDLQLAAAKQVAWAFHQKDREREGIVSVSSAGTSINYLTDAWLPEVEDVLHRYARRMPSWL